jgi:hypothetical protein
MTLLDLTLAIVVDGNPGSVLNKIRQNRNTSPGSSGPVLNQMSSVIGYGIYDFVRNMFVNIVYKHVYIHVFNPAWEAACFQEGLCKRVKKHEPGSPVGCWFVRQPEGMSHVLYSSSSHSN